MLKSFLVFSILLTSTYAGYLPEIEINGDSISVDRLCFDNGFVREKELSHPERTRSVLKKTVLEFADGSEFVKNDFIKSEFEYYNPKNKKFEKISINECASSLVDSRFSIKETRREASSNESVFYGNLKNYKVNDIALEEWKKWKSYDRYLRYSGEKDRVTLVNNFSELAEQTQLNHYASWRDLSGKVIGGEQSGGGGAGKVRINMNMTAKDVNRQKISPSGLERLFGLSPLLEKVIYDNKKISRARIYVTVPKK